MVPFIFQENTQDMEDKIITLKNGKTATIRRAHPEDSPQYAAMSNQCYFETRFLSRCPEDEMFEPNSMVDYIKNMEKAEKEILLMAVCDEKIVGNGRIDACLDRRKMKHKCDLDISLLKDYWGIGLGKALMVELIDFAKQSGFEKIDLNVAHDNARAIGLYEHLGFKETGREVNAMKHGDGDYSDFVFMTLFLK